MATKTKKYRFYFEGGEKAGYLLIHDGPMDDTQDQV
jgi:hypothetical protein